MDHEVASNGARGEEATGVKAMVVVGVISLVLGIALSVPSMLMSSGDRGSEGRGGSPGVAEVDTADVSAGVAATVNGTQIGEAAVTTYIGNFRAANGLTTAEAWGTWLTNNGYNAESLRSETVDFFVNQELMRQAAERYGVTADEEEVDARLADAKATYGSPDEWEAALAATGTTEHAVRESARMSLLQEGLVSYAAKGVKASDAEVLETVQVYAPYFAGAKRSSHILFSAGNADEAADVLGLLRSGELEFPDAVARYSLDAETKGNGGDVGWDRLGSLSQEYVNALAELQPGEISEPVADAEGVHLILCEEVLSVPGEIASLDDVPSSFADAMRVQADASAEQLAFTQFMNEFRNGSEVDIVPMPEGLPYDIDLTPYVEAMYAGSTREGGE